MNPLASRVAALCLAWSCTLAAQAEPMPLTTIAEQIRAQYDNIDEQMLRQPYDTRALVIRRDDPPRLEVTSFRPDRPPGEREQLEQVNGEAPGRSDLRRFNRRPQPDARDEQPIRLLMDHDSLALVEEVGPELHFRFQPVLLLDGEPSEYGHLFRGEVVWNGDDHHLTRVDMFLAEPFSYRLFNIEAFHVAETFQRIGDSVLRETYIHEIELRNRLLDLSNSAEIEFSYPLDSTLLHSRR